MNEAQNADNGSLLPVWEHLRPLCQKRRLSFAMLCTGLLGAMAAVLSASSWTKPETYEVRPLSKAVTIDGVIDSEWRDAQIVLADKPMAGREPTAVRLAFDDAWLYVGLDCTDTRIGTPEDDFYRNDFVLGEIRVGRPETAHSNEFRFRATPHGGAAVRVHRGPSLAMVEFHDYTTDLDPELYRFAVARTPGGWSVELALSWEAVRPRVPVMAEPFRFHVSRRNVNESAIEVGDWPHEREVRFTFSERPGM